MFFCESVLMPSTLNHCMDVRSLPLYVLSGSEANRTARLRPIPEEQPVISTTFFSIAPESPISIPVCPPRVQCIFRSSGTKRRRASPGYRDQDGALGTDPSFSPSPPPHLCFYIPHRHKATCISKHFIFPANRSLFFITRRCVDITQP